MVHIAYNIESKALVKLKHMKFLLTPSQEVAYGISLIIHLRRQELIFLTQKHERSDKLLKQTRCFASKTLT